MSRVYILRHAKAASPLPAMKDFERPLTPSGIETADRLGATMMARGLVPETVVCSPSRRTRETLEGVAKYFHVEVPTSYDHDIYAREHEYYLEVIRAETTDSILIVGHNPMCEDLINALVSSGNPDAVKLMTMGTPPGALAIIDLPDALADARPRAGFLDAFIVDGQ